MIRLFTIIITFLFVVAQQATAQVTINEPNTVTEMLERYTELNEQDTRVRGYRILIYSTRDRNRMERILRNFQYAYPNIGADWKHDRPDYKIRAGAFETKLDAQRLLNVIRQDYPDASIMTDYNMRSEELIY
ncbi:MAG: SPOR domain-containing protein [Bacteroidota bacterium]